MVPTDKGRPPKIDKVWFRARYGEHFPDFLDDDKDDILDACIDDVYALFYGVADLWSHMDRKPYEDKTRLCYGLLVAWYVADLFPEATLGVMSTGGIPLKAKKIGGTIIQFAEAKKSAGAVNNADLLQSLKSNAFGAKAYMMIKTSGKLNFFLTY